MNKVLFRMCQYRFSFNTCSLEFLRDVSFCVIFISASRDGSHHYRSPTRWVDWALQNRSADRRRQLRCGERMLTPVSNSSDREQQRGRLKLVLVDSSRETKCLSNKFGYLRHQNLISNNNPCDTLLKYPWILISLFVYFTYKIIRYGDLQAKYDQQATILHWGKLTHKYSSRLGQHRFRFWRMACSATTLKTENCQDT